MGDDDKDVMSEELMKMRAKLAGKPQPSDIELDLENLNRQLKNILAPPVSKALKDVFVRAYPTVSFKKPAGYTVRQGTMWGAAAFTITEEGLVYRLSPKGMPPVLETYVSKGKNHNVYIDVVEIRVSEAQQIFDNLPELLIPKRLLTARKLSPEMAERKRKEQEAVQHKQEAQAKLAEKLKKRKNYGDW